MEFLPEEWRHIEYIVVPIEKLTDEKFMGKLRKARKLNLDLPGCIELEHPNRFLELRKVEEFRHTPIVPIPESWMFHYKQ